jgi:hypothetical protein
MVRGKVMSVSPPEGTFVMDQLDPTSAFTAGRRPIRDTIQAKEVVAFIMNL